MDDLSQLRAAARTCTACSLYQAATQVVFGEGPPDAHVMFVGEVPGDHEDREGHPFVGPAGRLLRTIMAEVGLAPHTVYFTNAVKHFKFEERGTRRLHKKPNRTEVVACHQWLEAELEAVSPAIVVALGVTAASSLVGHEVVIRDVRGLLEPWPGPGRLLVTVHPSSILRVREEAERRAARDALANDLRIVAEAATAAEG